MVLTKTTPISVAVAYCCAGGEPAYVASAEGMPIATIWGTSG